MWARHTMLNVKLLEKVVDRAVFTTPIRLNCFNFGIKEPLNIRLKGAEN
jgi:hypothetical protein